MKHSSHSTNDSQRDSIDIQKAKRQSKGIKVYQLQKTRKSSNSLFNNFQKKQVFQSLNVKKFSPQIRTYISDIHDYIKSQQKNELILQNYMKWQTDINSQMRQILIGWIISVSNAYNLQQETLNLAVLLIDKYSYLRNIIIKKYQVLGGACLFIAAKYFQVRTPQIKKYVTIAAGQYNQNDLLNMQNEILISFNFDIKQKLTLSLFNIKCLQFQVCEKVKDLGYFLFNICLIQYKYCRLKSIYLSLAIFYFSMKLNFQKIANIRFFTLQNNLNEDTFYKYLNYVQRIFQNRFQNKFDAVNKKYSYLFNQQLQLI